MNIPNRNIGKVVAISSGRRHSRQPSSKNPSDENKSSKIRGNKINNIRWYHYVQFVVFLAIMAYLMQLCSGG